MIPGLTLQIHTIHMKRMEAGGPAYCEGEAAASDMTNMHCVHNHNSKGINYFWFTYQKSSLPVFVRQSLSCMSICYTSCIPVFQRRNLSISAFLACELLSPCVLSFASVLHASLLTSSRLSSSPSCVSTLLFFFHLRLLFRFLSVARTRTFLLGLPLLSPTPISLLQPAHP